MCVIRTRRPLDVVVWTNEEGTRFQPGAMGSNAFVEPALIGKYRTVCDASGVTMIAACDLYRYKTLGVDGYHDNCADNMRLALKAIVVERVVVPSPGQLLQGDIHVIEPHSSGDEQISHLGEELGYVIEGAWSRRSTKNAICCNRAAGRIVIASRARSSRAFCGLIRRRLSRNFNVHGLNPVAATPITKCRACSRNGNRR